jgi:hypothetical protein
MSSPIGRPPAAGGVGAAREAAREETRETERGGARRRDGVGRLVPDAGDRVTLSPQALRGPAGNGEESGAEGGAASDGADTAATGFRDGGEALLAARGLAFVLRADPIGAVHAHDQISPLRAAALLRS